MRFFVFSKDFWTVFGFFFLGKICCWTIHFVNINQKSWSLNQENSLFFDLSNLPKRKSPNLWCIWCDELDHVFSIHYYKIISIFLGNCSWKIAEKLRDYVRGLSFRFWVRAPQSFLKSRDLKLPWLLAFWLAPNKSLETCRISALLLIKCCQG